MRLVLRILTVPIAAALTAVAAFFSFATALSGALLGFISVILFLLAIFSFITSGVMFGAALAVMAFLTSQYGLPKLAGFLAEKLAGLALFLREFITG